ncbi:hypothetical protein CBM2592_U10031 [Cupriavidus taiwanensis]|nr:hypothetical protein CBM2592_U10031 [Cupriavidus taiwanensis]
MGRRRQARGRTGRKFALAMICVGKVQVRGRRIGDAGGDGAASSGQAVSAAWMPYASPAPATRAPPPRRQIRPLCPSLSRWMPP